MNIEGKTVWQHAAGDWGHEHVDICLDWEVILVGPGDKPWSETERNHQRREVVDFCEEMQSGDIVVLKMGLSAIYGVGFIANYDWCDEFNDVDGWDLGHTRRVRWVWTYKDNNDTAKEFSGRPLARSSTCRVHNPTILNWLKKLDVANHDTDHSYKELPEKQKNVTREDIAKYLFDMGIASDSIRNLLDQHGEFLRIANWYNEHWKEWPSEHETVSHLVVPLLRILGWTPQRMALEWKLKGGRMDIALFTKLQPDTQKARIENNLDVVVEAKSLFTSCLSWAVSQAEGCVESVGNCRRLIVTDGLRYGVFTRRKGENFVLFAYLNLIRLRSYYPVYDCKGAKEAIFAMTPEWKYE